jgi:hypothetical protein
VFQLAVALSLSVLAAGESPDADVRTVADSYLRALTGSGDDRARELLLGGATMDAQIFSLDSARIVSKEPMRREEGNLANALGLMRELDRAGRQARNRMMKGAKSHGDEMGYQEVSQAEASKLLAPTREKAQKFLKACPVLAYLTRVGKELYWHPRNPMRALLHEAGDHGQYRIELHRFKVESLEGPSKAPRQWPLRIVRFRSGGLDTGWRILPASDWSVE